ncbi:pilin [Spiribacter halobius]|nr:pilin [Spiribacter halobius]
MSATAGLRADISEQFALTDTIPAAAGDLNTNLNDIATAQYISGVAYANGTITVTWDGATSSLAGDMTIAPVNNDPQQGWVCAAANGMEANHLPGGCAN